MNGRYRRHSGHCSALARNGSVANDPQRKSRSPVCCDAQQLPFYVVECGSSGLGHLRETARFHHSNCQLGSNVASRRTRAAKRAHAAYRRAHAVGRRRSGSASSNHGVRAGSAAIGLDRWPQRADRHSLGRRQCRRHSQIRSRIGCVAARLRQNSRLNRSRLDQRSARTRSARCGSPVATPPRSRCQWLG